MTSRRNCIAGLTSGAVLGQQQRLVLAQDRGLERLELRAWVDAELLDERLARGAVGRERVGLAPRAVEREHELRARSLAQRLRCDERLELGDELGVAPEREVRLDPLLERDEPELLEPGDLGLGERLVEEVRERRPAPERERLAQRALGRSRIAARERSADPRPRGGRSGGRRRARARARARSPGARVTSVSAPSALRSWET